ncbi:T9SS type A sorting domain-containing protein [Polluticoccus soli]|uniref:T9SS type A sorting domain-containing protein n=1 Tax=Polluticoccus soli TaxID=3034150 RepID=UPI0023E11FF0|nr:T9SS type A sorting domain-containing protein [Flavipsychrobacter sp. JY13-12]
MRFKGYISTICLFALNSLLPAAFAQAVVNPLPGADVVCQPAQQSNTVNCDMVELTNSEKLFAITWDDNNQSFIKVFLRGEVSQTQLITLPAGANAADIAIANDLNNTGDLKLAVTYQAGSDVYLSLYNISGTSTVLSTSLSGTYKLNTESARNAHIDMLADNTAKINSKPSLHKFGVSWEEFDPTTNAMSVQARAADVASPTAYSWTVYVPQAEKSDIATYVNAATNKEYLCVLYVKPNSVTNTGSDLRMLETELDGSLNQYHFLEKGKDFSSARIECQALYNGVGSKWAAVAAVGTITPGMYAATIYNDSKTGADISTPLGNYNNDKPAIAAGSGKTSDQYAAVFFPMYQGSLYMTSAGQWNNSWNANYYKVNQSTMDITSGAPAVAVSSCSNDGNGQLIAWFNGSDIVYKIINDAIQSADPTVIKTTAVINGLTVYPNPATDVLQIAGSKAAAYTVADITGRSVLVGSFDGSAMTVDIHSLTAGSYILHLQDKQAVRFVKQ